MVSVATKEGVGSPTLSLAETPAVGISDWLATGVLILGAISRAGDVGFASVSIPSAAGSEDSVRGG